MANPPVNRRPGVDADIIQGTWVRGYDVPAGDQTIPVPAPCDLIVSNGKSQIDQSVSNLVFASRTDSIGQPIFVMAQGDDPTAPIGIVNFHIGRDADPNGTISGVGPGALYASYGTPGLWQLQLDNTTWVEISDDLGGEDLQQTLAIGNSTGGLNILLTNGDFLKGEDSTVGDAADANVAGGNATGIAGDGGRVYLVGGTSVGGVTGAVEIETPDASSTGGSGRFRVNTGDSKLGGNSGGISMVVGEAGDVGFGGTGGTVQINAGRSRSSGAGAFAGGRVLLYGGQGTSQGQGGDIFMRAGVSSDFDTIEIFPAPVAGQGGAVNIRAGSSSQNRPGGSVTLQAGTGGSAGANGGDVTLRPGQGGGGFDDGQVVADGIFRADNVKRGSGDPNGVVSGSEGDVYQRIDGGTGQIWLNTNGTSTGWVQLAAVGDFVESFEQLNYGYFSRAGRDLGGSVEDAWSDIGIFKGLRSNSDEDPTFGGNLENGPYVAFEAVVNGNRSAIDLSTGSGNLPSAREQRFLLTFRARNSNAGSNKRIFLGVSTLDAQNQLASALPPGGSYLGFLLDGGVGGNWRVITSNGLGITGPLDTGVNPAAVSASPEAWHFVIDATDVVSNAGQGVVTFYILDPALQLQSTIVVPTTLPTLGTQMGLVMGLQRISALAPSAQLEVVHASIVNDALVSGQGGGTVSGLALAQVLINGNETGALPILMNQGSQILGVTDDNAGDGANVSVFGGATTLATNDTGSLFMGSGNAFGGGAENPGTSTGVVFLSSGFQFAATSQGDTGSTTVGTGSHVGTDGTTGNIDIFTGLFSNAGAGSRTQGDINIAPGTFTPNTATFTGNVTIKGGSSSLDNVQGGDVTILSGENSASIGNTGNIDVFTFDANLDGTSGEIEIQTGQGGTNNGDSGVVRILTGAAPSGDSGFVGIASGNAGGSAGDAVLGCGLSGTGDGSDVFLLGGTTTDPVGVGGNIELTPGTGGGGDGQVIVNGKLTVTGPIDPTALGFTGVASNPLTIGGGIDGILWVDNTGPSGQLIYTNADGDNNITTGGGATTLGSLTDVTLTAPAPGETLTYNGVDWVNLPGAGGSPLATILGIGNTTGALPIVVSGTAGSRVTSDSDLVLEPAVAPGNAVVLDGLRWPESDGAAGFVLTTNGAGQLSFQPGGGGSGGPSFGEAFTRMQWGSVQAATAAPFYQADGFFTSASITTSAILATTNDVDGYSFPCLTPALANGIAGVEIEPTGPGVGLELQSRPLVSLKFDGPSLDTNVRFFVGLTDAPNIGAQTGAPAPAQRFVGLQIYTDIPQTTFHFVTNDGGVATTQNTGASALGSGFELVIDGTVTGEVTLTLYDNAGTQLATHTFVANLPTATVGLGIQLGMTTTNATAKSADFYGASAVTRGDLLNAVGGGGGNQDLASVLGFGAETNGIPITGDNSTLGSGGSLSLFGGNSTGGGGDGGNVNLIAGIPDPGGNGAGGSINVATGPGAGTGDAGDLVIVTSAGGATNGDGGDTTLTLGAGNGTGKGGSFGVTAGDGGSGGGGAGVLLMRSGDAAGGNAAGGAITLETGDGFGTGAGGNFVFNGGDGGAGGGDGGSLVFTPGAGMGGGADGTFVVNGDATINGKLNVTGLIDPTGLLLDSQAMAPFTPAGSDGGIWVNNAGELVFTNAGGDLNLSTAIGGGVTFLDALLTAGYGMVSAGNPSTGPDSYGVYGGSVVAAVSPGPPPASIVFNEDGDGPFVNLAVGAAALSEAFVGTADVTLERGSRFRARFKFQITSPAHTDERIFVGFTDDTSVTTPSIQLSNDDPVGAQYVGLRQSLAGFNLEFVARGSGGAMVPVFAIPTDASVHYLDIDASDAGGDVTFTLLSADATTVEATHTEPASLLLPDLANALRPFTGIHSATGTTPRGIDFYYSNVVTRADVVDAVTGVGGGGGGTPALDVVLAAGDTTGANGIVFSSGSSGISSESALANTGSAGQPLAVVLGAGSSETGTGVAGGSGGAFSVTTGVGGTTDAGAANGGLGGNMSAVLGAGGDNTGGANGGMGGTLTVTAGVGGDATGPSGDGGNGGSVQFFPGGGGTSSNAIGGNGGDFGIDLSPASGGAGSLQGGRAGRFIISGGDGGSSAAGTGGDGSSILISGGLPGTGAVSNGDGGRVSIQAGGSLGATGSPGGVELLAGNASAAFSGEGAVQFASSPVGGDVATSGYLIIDRAAPAGSGAPIVVQSGGALAGSNGDGGDLTLRTGVLDGAGDDGHIFLLAGGAVSGPTSGAVGGNIQLHASPIVGVVNGGTLSLTSPLAPNLAGLAGLAGGDAQAASNATGGTLVVGGGQGDGNGFGGLAVIRGGLAGATGDGGDVQVRGGDATGLVNTGGDVRLIPGTSPGGPGTVKIEGRIDPAVGGGVAGIQYGTFTVPGAAGSVVVNFNVAFGATPTTINFNLQSFSATAGGRDIVITAITTTSFTLNSAPSFGPGEVIHWVAFQ